MSTVTKPIMLDETGERIADALEDLVDKLGTHTITITITSEDFVAIENQTVNVYNATTGELYGSMVYNSPTSLTVDVPHGFSYKIEAVCTTAQHFCTDKPSGICLQNTSVTMVYKTIGSLATFPDVKAVLNNGFGKYVVIGSEVSFTHSTYGNLVFEIVDYDSEEESFTLLSKKVICQKQFDAPEASYKATNAILAAGNYTFKNGNTSYYFTTTSPVPVGGQVRFTTSAFDTYSAATDTSYLEHGTVSTTANESPTDLGTLGSGVLNHYDRIQYGSNDYGESNLRQWLNATGLNWYTPKTMFDRPPAYASESGFLTGVPSSVLDAIDDATVKCVAQNTYTAPDSSHPKNTRYTVTDKFFLASDFEIFGSSLFDDGSTIFDLYIGAGNTDRIKLEGTSARIWWLRSPGSSAHTERNVDTSGSVTSSHTATSFYGAAAACKISKSS